ncbi:uncharacterized protein LOC124942850 [Impatiens glandulifera]|uniref:uncharacterized protein LOC124942850 n=1 Tax=Impatiens glandulifera TaxID=253017 RepID=UPI001FB12AD8|nr:uncharacterized protein LOC124942850 [Impatiens glandulifera]
MGVYNYKVWLFMAVLVAAHFNEAVAVLTAAECKEERRIGVNACKSVIFGRMPSPECCLRVRISHVECVCPIVTPKLAALVDVNKAVRLIEGCGRRVPHHFKCGSITTP